MNENSDDASDRPEAPADGTDLLGDPARPYKDPRGRKKLRKINELKDRVAVLAATGMTREEIADAIGCCEKTLRTHFLPQLNKGKASKKAEMVNALFEAGMNGNVAAMKAYLQLCEKGEAAPPAPKQPTPGKKEQTLIDSNDAYKGSSWAQLLDPPETMQ